MQAHDSSSGRLSVKRRSSAQGAPPQVVAKSTGTNEGAGDTVLGGAVALAVRPRGRHTSTSLLVRLGARFLSVNGLSIVCVPPRRPAFQTIIRCIAFPLLDSLYSER